MDLSLAVGQYYSATTDRIDIIPGKRYVATTKVKCIAGKPKNAFFGVILYHKEQEEHGRRIKWLEDFSAKDQEIRVVFNAPENCMSIRLAYRINIGTPARAQCQYSLLPLEKATIKETDEEESFATPPGLRAIRVAPLTPKEEAILEKNLIWIFASQRSGTSWLSLQLLTYKTYSMNEPLIGKHIGHFAFDKEDRFVTTMSINDSRPSYFFSGKYEHLWLIHLRKFVLNRIHAQFQDLSRKIIVKEPNGSMAANIISKALPNSKIVVLIRDGRDVIDSEMDAHSAGGWGTAQRGKVLQQSQRPGFIKRSAKAWNTVMDSVLLAYENHSEANRIMVKYEDLRHHTIDELGKLYKFIEVSINSKELHSIIEQFSYENVPNSEKGKGKFVRSAKPGGWRDNFNDEEKKLMHSLMEKRLQKLGYEI